MISVFKFIIVYKKCRQWWFQFSKSSLSTLVDNDSLTSWSDLGGSKNHHFTYPLSCDDWTWFSKIHQFRPLKNHRFSMIWVILIQIRRFSPGPWSILSMVWTDSSEKSYCLMYECLWTSSSKSQYLCLLLIMDLWNLKFTRFGPVSARSLGRLRHQRYLNRLNSRRYVVLWGSLVWYGDNKFGKSTLSILSLVNLKSSN